MSDSRVGSDWSVVSDGARSPKRSSDNGDGGRAKSPRSEGGSTSELAQRATPTTQDVGEQPVGSSSLDRTELDSGGGGSGGLLQGTLESAKATPTDQAPTGAGPATVAQLSVPPDVTGVCEERARGHPGDDHLCDHGLLWEPCGHRGVWEAKVTCWENTAPGDLDTQRIGRRFCALHAVY